MKPHAGVRILAGEPIFKGKTKLSVKSRWIECVDEIRRLEYQLASTQSLLKIYSSRKLEYEKELLKNDDGVTEEGKHAYLLGIYYDPDLKPKYRNNPQTREMREELLKLEKEEREEREEKRKKLAEELNNFSVEFIDKLLAIIKPVNLKA